MSHSAEHGKRQEQILNEAQTPKPMATRSSLQESALVPGLDPNLPPAQGLYSPLNEHDACGVGFVAAPAKSAPTSVPRIEVIAPQKMCLPCMKCVPPLWFCASTSAQSRPNFTRPWPRASLRIHPCSILELVFYVLLFDVFVPDLWLDSRTHFSANNNPRI